MVIHAALLVNWAQRLARAPPCALRRLQLHAGDGAYRLVTEAPRRSGCRCGRQPAPAPAPAAAAGTGGSGDASAPTLLLLLLLLFFLLVDVFLFEDDPDYPPRATPSGTPGCRRWVPAATECLQGGHGGHEPDFTNWAQTRRDTLTFMGCLDYVFVSPSVGVPGVEEAAAAATAAATEGKESGSGNGSGGGGIVGAH